MVAQKMEASFLVEKKSLCGHEPQQTHAQQKEVSFFGGEKTPAGMRHSKPMLNKKKEVPFLVGKKAPAGMSHSKPMLKKRRCRFLVGEKNCLLYTSPSPRDS